MANYLKLNKSYIGNDILKNPEFNMLGPEEVLNADFSQSYPSTVPDIEGVMFNNWETDNADLGGGSYKLEAIPNGYKQTLITLPTVPNDMYKTRLKQDLSSILEVGKIYKVSWTVKGSSNYLLYNLIAKTNGADDITPAASVRMGDNQEAIVVEYEVKVATNTDQYLSFYMATDAQVGDWIEVTNVTIKETGQIDYSPNPIFTGIASGTSVDVISSWSAYGAPVSKNVDNIGGQNNLVIVATGSNQGAALDLVTVPDGMEVNIKIERVTGDLGELSLFLNGYPLGSPLAHISTLSGSVDYTFVKQSGTTNLFFRAGDNSAGTTKYYNITVRPTKVFAYAWNRGGSGVGATGNIALFSNNNLKLTSLAGTSNAIVSSDTSAYTTGTEFVVTFNVLDKSDGVIFEIFDRVNYLPVNVKLGENEFRYKAANNGSNFILNVKSAGPTDEFITLDNIQFQEVKNQPKLIGVDNVSTVSAPTNSTVVINNGLTDGADTVTVTYAEADASSTVQMRNFFQDAIVEAANANNTGKVIEIKSPVLITDIVAS